MIFATKDGDAYSVVSDVCHGHLDDEVWLDATFGSWEEPFADHVSLSCRITSEGAGLVDALVASRGEANYYGQRLTRDGALDSRVLTAFWQLVDVVVKTVPEVKHT